MRSSSGVFNKLGGAHGLVPETMRVELHTCCLHYFIKGGRVRKIFARIAANDLFGS
jgi:hypothetical protein